MKNKIERKILASLGSAYKHAEKECEKDCIQRLIKALRDSTDVFIYNLWLHERFIKLFMAKYKIVIPQAHLDYLAEAVDTIDKSYFDPSQHPKWVILMMNHDCECYHYNVEGYYKQFLDGTLKKLVP